MRVVPTRLHGIVDYGWGLFLLASPFLFGFSGERSALWTATVFGLGAITYSLLTDYELGLLRVLPMPAHLVLDAVAGAALAVTPFVLGLGRAASWTFVLLGALSILASAVTRQAPTRDRVAR